MNTKFLLSSDNNNRNELLKKKIIHYYIANGDATIADLGREMDLSIPTVTKLVAELQDDGYILDFGKQETNGGRKPNIYGLNPASGYFVGVDMLKDKLNIAAIDFKGDKVQLEENIPYQLENTPASLEQFCKIIDDFIVSLPVERNKILAIGVNITGRVNPASGYSYSIFYFEEKPLAQILEERLQTKVFIENDSRAIVHLHDRDLFLHRSDCGRYLVRQMDSAECTGTHLYRFHRACLDHSGTPAVRIRRQFRHDCRRRTLFRYRFRYFRRQQHADPLPVRIATLPGDRLRHYEHDRGICRSDHHKTVGRVDGCR